MIGSVEIKITTGESKSLNAYMCVFYKFILYTIYFISLAV